MNNCKLAMKTILWFFSLIFFLTAHADDVLDRFYKNTHSIKADFNQVVARTDGKLIEQSRGHLSIKRPDKFLLEYIEPLEQKYISNARTLWIYDAELEQVTINPLDEGLEDSPALLISSDKDVRKNYTVKHLADSNDLERVELVAKTENMTFERVILVFNNDVLNEMIMYDSFNQVTTLKLSNIIINQSIPEDTFNFKPPEGVDIIGHAQ
jgi:outer membrane lipoprotein carrier protein